jgi:hypothetical protein
MADLIIPEVDTGMMIKLKQRAQLSGKSLKEVVCDILTEAVKPGAKAAAEPSDKGKTRS